MPDTLSPSTAALWAQVIPVFFIALLLATPHLLRWSLGKPLQKHDRLSSVLAAVGYALIFAGVLATEILAIQLAEGPEAVDGTNAIVAWWFFCAMLTFMVGATAWAAVLTAPRLLRRYRNDD